VIHVNVPELRLGASLSDGRAQAADRDVTGHTLQLRFNIVELHDAVREPWMLPPQWPSCDRKHTGNVGRIEERVESVRTDQAARSREQHYLRFWIWHNWLSPAVPECCFHTL
jgi:hypothetical protein